MNALQYFHEEFNVKEMLIEREMNVSHFLS
jgi:hypothetical protein